MWTKSIKVKNVKVNDLAYLSNYEKKGIAQVLDFLNSELKLTFEVILYGSKARGDYTVNSDIDLIIISHAFNDSHVKNEIRRYVRSINAMNNIFLSPRLATIEDLNNPFKYGGTYQQNVITDGQFISNNY